MEAVMLRSFTALAFLVVAGCNGRTANAPAAGERQLAISPTDTAAVRRLCVSPDSVLARRAPCVLRGDFERVRPF